MTLYKTMVPEKAKSEPLPGETPAGEIFDPLGLEPTVLLLSRLDALP
jgi:hypothetical protein